MTQFETYLFENMKEAREVYAFMVKLEVSDANTSETKVRDAIKVVLEEFTDVDSNKFIIGVFISEGHPTSDIVQYLTPIY